MENLKQKSQQDYQLVLAKHRKELKREEWLEGNNNGMKDALFTGKIKGIKRH